jgi:hypothetical protein
VPKAISQALQSTDYNRELICLRGESLTVDLNASVRHKDAGEVVKGETCGLSGSDQGELLKHVRIEQAPQTAPPDRPDQAALLIVAKGRCRHARQLRDFANIQVAHFA